MSSHDAPHPEPAPKTGSHDTPGHKPDAGHETPVATEPAELSVEEIQRRIDLAARKETGKSESEKRIEEIRDQLRAVDQKIAGLKPSPVKDAGLFVLGSAMDKAPKIMEKAGKNMDHAIMESEKWFDKVMKKNLKWAFDMPVVGWVLGKVVGYKPMGSAIEKEHAEHKKAEAKAKWKEKENKKIAGLRKKGVSEEKIAEIEAEDEEKYDDKVAEKEAKDHGGHGGGHDDHGGGHGKKDDHGGGHGKKDDHGHGGGHH